VQIQKISALTLNRDNNHSKTKVQHKMALPSELKVDSVSFKGNDDDLTGWALAAFIIGTASCLMTSGATSFLTLL